MLLVLVPLLAAAAVVAAWVAAMSDAVQSPSMNALSSMEIPERVTPPSKRGQQRLVVEPELGPELELRNDGDDTLVTGWNPAHAVEDHFRFSVAQQRDGCATTLPGELRIDANGLRFVARHATEGSPAADDVAGDGAAAQGRHLQQQQDTTYDFAQIVSWKFTSAGDNVVLLDLNIGGTHRVKFEAEQSDSLAISKAMLGFIEAQLAAMKRAEEVKSADRERVMAWLDGNVVAETPQRECATYVSYEDRHSAPWASQQHLRKRPEALDLPDDVRKMELRNVPIGSDSTGWEAPHGVSTPQRELSIAMRAAAIASEQHSPRTAALKLATYELECLLDKAPATSRMQHTAWLQDTQKVVAQAERVAEIATRAQSINATPTRIQAQLRTQLMPIPGHRAGGDDCQPALDTGAVDV